MLYEVITTASTKLQILCLVEIKLIIKEIIMAQFKAMKFRVENEEHSKKIQEYLFSLGYRWDNCSVAKLINSKYLYTCSQGFLWYGSNKDLYEKYCNKEYKLKEVVTYELEEVKEEPKISVNIAVNGRAVNQALVAMVETLIKNTYIEVQDK